MTPESIPTPATAADFLEALPIERVYRYYRAPLHDLKAPLLAFVEMARKTIDIEIYGFAWTPLCAKLIQKHLEGVRVRILFDHTQACGTKERTLVAQIAAAGIEHYVGTSPRHQIRHSKVIIVDGEWVECGSLNYSESAFAQNNTVLIMKDKEVALDLTQDWEDGKMWIVQNQPQYNEDQPQYNEDQPQYNPSQTDKPETSDNSGK